MGHRFRELTPDHVLITTQPPPSFEMGMGMGMGMGMISSSVLPCSASQLSQHQENGPWRKTILSITWYDDLKKDTTYF